MEELREKYENLMKVKAICKIAGLGIDIDVKKIAFEDGKYYVYYSLRLDPLLERELVMSTTDFYFLLTNRPDEFIDSLRELAASIRRTRGVLGKAGWDDVDFIVFTLIKLALIRVIVKRTGISPDQLTEEDREVIDKVAGLILNTHKSEITGQYGLWRMRGEKIREILVEKGLL